MDNRFSSEIPTPQPMSLARAFHSPACILTYPQPHSVSKDINRQTMQSHCSPYNVWLAGGIFRGGGGRTASHTVRRFLSSIQPLQIFCDDVFGIPFRLSRDHAPVPTDVRPYLFSVANALGHCNTNLCTKLCSLSAASTWIKSENSTKCRNLQLLANAPQICKVPLCNTLGHKLKLKQVAVNPESVLRRLAVPVAGFPLSCKSTASKRQRKQQFFAHCGKDSM